MKRKALIKFRFLMLSAVIALLFVGLAPIAVSASPKVVDNTGKTTFYGLFVGVNDDLDYAEKDAKDMESALDKWLVSWKPGNKKTLLGAAATKAAIESEINKFKKKAKSGDEFIFYFSGHGGNGGIGTGPNGKLDTTPAGDDKVHKEIVPGPNGKLDTTKAGDDVVEKPWIRGGPNDKLDTKIVGDDVKKDTGLIVPGPNDKLDTKIVGDDVKVSVLGVDIGIRTGPNDKWDSTPAGDDIRLQKIEPGPRPNSKLDSKLGGDDRIVGPKIKPGDNGKLDSVRAGDDIGPSIHSGPNGKLDSTPAKDDVEYGRKDGVKDRDEKKVDLRDEPDRFDNYIWVAGNVRITDDELTEMLSGFANGVSIVVILDSCFSGTFTDGTADLPAIKQVKGGKSIPIVAGNLAVLAASKGTTSSLPFSSGMFTRWLRRGLENDGKGKTVADAFPKDGITTAKELFFVAERLKAFSILNNDDDRRTNEDDVEYAETDYEAELFYTDNDMDGLIDEDPAPVYPVYWEKEKVGPVGGTTIPVNKLELLVPWIGLAAVIISAAAVTLVFVKRRKNA